MIKSSRFLQSAGSYADLQPANGPEICFCGRSNVGKSSLLNAIVGNRKLANVSQRPGKTQTLNLFEANEGQFYYVDLPGFGFAHVPKYLREKWKQEINDYLLNRPNLKLILHLVDVRHEPTALDRDFMLWLAENRRPFANVLTKADKLGNMRQKMAIEQLTAFHKNLHIEVPVVLTSSDSKHGIPELYELIRDFTSGNFEIIT